MTEQDQRRRRRLEGRQATDVPDGRKAVAPPDGRKAVDRPAGEDRNDSGRQERDDA